MPRSLLPLRPICLLLIALNLSACASSSDAIFQTVKMAVSRSNEAESLKPTPGMRYLRVTTDGRVVILVLGYLEAHPEGDVEVWYSAKGEVIQLQNGRIVRTAGLATDWRAVRYSALPAWDAIGNTPIEIQRRRDEMPGYRMNIEETLRLQAIAPPSDSLLAGIDARSLRWFEDRAPSGDANALPPARYGVSAANGKTDVVYGEQCLTKNLCLTWQRWPAEARTLPPLQGEGRGGDGSIPASPLEGGGEDLSGAHIPGAPH